MSTPEKYFIDKDIKVACVKASSFPKGVGEAYHKLGAALPALDQRKFYGISYGEKNGSIIYRAAASQLHEGEAEEHGLETFTIKKGEYISEFLEDWKKDETQIAKTFQKLLSNPHVDKKQGYCLEIYPNTKDVQCLVLLDPQKQ
jgi:predicted transcriptional regulator YdeE